MQYFLQQLVNGLAVGSLYALIALGYTMVYGILRLINFAHGDIYMLGAFFGYFSARMIAAMQKADSPDPAKYLPELHKISYDGATGHIEFDDKGDRKDAEITIFQMKNGKVDPVAIVKAGKTTKIGDTASASAAAPAAPAMAPAMAPAPKK